MSMHLFLVEDNEEVAFLMRLHLERAGFRVTACRTGADALIVLANEQFDFVLLDYLLPDMDGVTLLQTLAREGIRTPVLVMTADREIRNNVRVATAALKAGGLDFFHKDDALTFIAELPQRVRDALTRFRLQESNKLLIAALESARDGICITDLKGNILNVNKALETMTGYDRQELIGQTPRLLKSGKHGPEFYASLWSTILTGQSWQGEMINCRKDGNLIDTSLTISPIVDTRGDLTHFVGIYRDETDRKQLERQLSHAQKMQSVGTLAGGVAHEFNNLLAGIQGYAALGLREPRVSASLQEFLQFIVDLSDRAAKLTRQLLAFARKPALSPQPTPMARLLTTTAELVRHSLHIDVEVEVDDPQPNGMAARAMADANQLQQVLINLALNSRDAQTRPQPILFRMQLALQIGELQAFPENVPPGDYVVFEVRDRGTGMTQDVLNQALDPFFTTKEVGLGTGLGLSVASGIIHGHRGWLTIDSELGVGTAVRIYLPRLASPAPVVSVDGTGDGTGLDPEKTAARDILVVDDEQAVLDVVRRFLEIAGHRVTCATTGTEAIRHLAGTKRFDLLVLDLMVKGEDGAATFRHIRQQWPDLPVLLCTGLLHTDPGATAFQGEPVQLLRKPFRMDEMWKAVNQSLR
jgi:PAS domain S-box-containing protein